MAESHIQTWSGDLDAWPTIGRKIRGSKLSRQHRLSTSLDRQPRLSVTRQMIRNIVLPLLQPVLGPQELRSGNQASKYLAEVYIIYHAWWNLTTYLDRELIESLITPHHVWPRWTATVDKGVRV